MKLEELFPPVRFISFELPNAKQLKMTEGHDTVGLRDILRTGMNEFQNAIVEYGSEHPFTLQHAATIYDIIVVIRAHAKMN